MIPLAPASLRITERGAVAAHWLPDGGGLFLTVTEGFNRPVSKHVWRVSPWWPEITAILGLRGS